MCEIKYAMALNKFRITGSFLFFLVLSMPFSYASTDNGNDSLIKQKENLVNEDFSNTPLIVEDEEFDEVPAGTWSFFGNSNIMTNQSQFSNWQGGGLNSIALATSLSLNLTYQTNTLNWQTTFDAGYGLMLQGSSGKWFKNDDRLAITTQVGKRASEAWNYTMLVSAQSQFRPGYYTEEDITPISDFFSPGYVVASIGLEYKPDYKLSVFLGPVSTKNTFVLNQDLANQGAYGVEPGEYDFLTETFITEGKNLRSETGGFIRVTYNEPRIMKNVSLSSTLELFSNYLYKAGNIDVNFENQLDLKINEYITTNLILHFIYDDDILIALDPEGTRFGPRLQFKEVLNVGLTINLGNAGY